jgi:hypothetical protein
MCTGLLIRSFQTIHMSLRLHYYTVRVKYWIRLYISYFLSFMSAMWRQNIILYSIESTERKQAKGHKAFNFKAEFELYSSTMLNYRYLRYWNTPTIILFPYLKYIISTKMNKLEDPSIKITYDPFKNAFRKGNQNPGYWLKPRCFEL